MSGLVAALLLFAGATPAAADWRRAESDNFIVYGEVGEARLREKVEQLEIFDQLLRMLTGTEAPPAPNKLPIYIVRGPGEMRLIREVGAGTGGFYSASAGAILAVIDTHAMRGEDGNPILFHEYAHHFMMQYRPGAYPRWWVEGFAEYAMTARIRADEVEFGNYSEGRVRLLGRSGWHPLDEILFGDGRAGTVEDRALFSAQSWLLTHYMLRDEERRGALASYLSAIGRGDDPRQAFTVAFGVGVREMEDDLRGYTRRMTFTRLGRNAAAPRPRVTVSILPRSADDLLLPQAALRLGLGEAWRQDMLERVRRAAARHDDAFARRVLAEAELLHGDAAVADRLLEPLLAESPGDAELLYLKGMRHLTAGRTDGAVRAAQFAEAQRWFARAHRADPNHYPTLFRYAEVLSVDPAHVSENTGNILLLATGLAPQVAEIRIEAARMLIARGRFEQAEQLLMPAAFAPHGGDAARDARALLDLARARRAAPSRAGAAAARAGH